MGLGSFPSKLTVLTNDRGACVSGRFVCSERVSTDDRENKMDERLREGAKRLEEELRQPLRDDCEYFHGYPGGSRRWKMTEKKEETRKT